jgi:outer membrane protein TolC
MNERHFCFLGATVVLLCSSAATAQDAGQRIDTRMAVSRALRNNASLRSSELELEQAREQVRAEEGRYPYVFQADAGYTRSVTPRLGPNDSVSTSRSRLYTVGSALRRTFPFGTTAEVRVQGERFEDDFRRARPAALRRPRAATA